MSRFADAYPFPTFPSPLRFAIAMAAVSVVFVTDVVAGAALDDVGRFLLLATAAATHLALFIVQGLLLTAVVSELRAARRSAERQARIAQAARRDGEAAN